MTRANSATNYIRLFEVLSPDCINGIDSFVSKDIHFKDPFNDLHGIDQFKALLFKTLEDVEKPEFKVTHQSWSDDVLFLRWSFQGMVRMLGDWQVEGMSEIRFDRTGLILDHIDHWDASEQFYGKLPFVGSVIRLIRRRLQVS